MRIVYLCHNYADTTLGGVAEFLHFLPMALKNQHIHIVIYTKACHRKITQLQAPMILPNGIPHYTGPFLTPRFFPDKQELTPLLQLCEQEKIDLLHAHGTYRSGYMARYVKKYLNIPFIVTSHGDISPINSKRMRRPHIKRRCQTILRDAKHVTHLTPLMAQISHQLYDTRHKSTIIPNGIDRQGWPALGQYPQKDYFFAIGRLEPEKGFAILIQAYAKLRQMGVTTSLVIAGTGSMQEILPREAEQFGLTVYTDFAHHDIPPASIIFTGYVQGDRKKLLFAEAKAVLVPTQPQSWEEAFGIVYLEAMMAGKAIIASDMPVCHYLRQFGLQATLVNACDKDAWVQAMLDFLSNPSRYQQMGVYNRQATENFDWVIIAKAYQKLYCSLCP